MTTATAATEPLLTAATTTESGQSTEAPAGTAAATGTEQQTTEAASGSETAAEGNQSTEQQQQEGKEGEQQQQQQTVEYNFTFDDKVAPDDGILEDLRTLATELSLTPEQAQKIADLGAKQATKWAESAQAMHFEAVNAWTEASKADAEFGGDKFGENLAVAKKALDDFGTPALKQLLDESGLSNHPEIIRWAYRAGKALSDDTVIPGDRNAIAPVDKAKVLFPNSNMN